MGLQWDYNGITMGLQWDSNGIIVGADESANAGDLVRHFGLMGYRKSVIWVVEIGDLNN